MELIELKIEYVGWAYWREGVRRGSLGFILLAMGNT